ncbi:unnamed protein product [Caenorhabditis sp. 36 PRJEB53466]|nr:unnamed protein product [Caenorhabditis sp. 36 PRJEB53466]
MCDCQFERVFRQLGRHVTQYLDFKSRIAMQLVSKSVAETVRSLPPAHFDFVELTPSAGPSKTVRICVMDVSASPIFVVDRTFERSEGIDNFLKLFKDSNSSIGTLLLGAPTGTNRAFPEFLADLVAKWTAARVLRVKTLKWGLNEQGGTLFLRVLRKLDPFELKSMTIWNGVLSGPVLKEFVGTEQFGSCEKVEIEPVIDYLSHHFFHFKKLKLKVNGLSANVFLDLVKIFHSKNHKPGSFFYLHSLSSVDITQIAGAFEMAKNRGERFEECYTFKNAKSQCILCVRISEDQLFGVVCRAKHLEEDLRELFVWNM